MKKLFPVVVCLAILSVATFVGSFFVERHYQGKAQLIQRVRRDAATDLFGDTGVPVGSPQLMIIDDRKAFTGSRASNGAAEVDEAYLERNGIYPLQMKTVSYVSGLVRGVSAVGAALMGLVALWIRRRA
jgi:hypothetical protein